MGRPKAAFDPEKEELRRNMAANLLHWRGKRPRSEIAALAGVSEKYLEMLEKGQRSLPSSQTAIRIAGAFGRDVNDLYSERRTDPDPSKVTPFVLTWSLSAEERAAMPEEMERAGAEIRRIQERLDVRLREIRRSIVAQRIKRR